MSTFWQRLFELMGTRLNRSSSFHPQSDSQTERVNQVLEQYLRCFISYQQDDWADLLPFAEFAYNNAEHSSTKVSPFFAIYGFHPRFDISTPRSSTNPAAEDHVSTLKRTHELLTGELRNAQARHKTSADRLRKDSPALKPGDRVWLLSRNIKSTRPSPKLDYRRLGPFSIIRQINSVAFQLALPARLKVHDVFHVSLLEPFVPNSIPGRIIPPPLPVEINGEQEFEVEEILDSCRRRGKLYYLVSWKGFDVNENSWEPAANVANAPDCLATFHASYPFKPGPRRRLV
jgi:hypothetical protein